MLYILLRIQCSAVITKMIATFYPLTYVSQYRNLFYILLLFKISSYNKKLRKCQFHSMLRIFLSIQTIINIEIKSGFYILDTSVCPSVCSLINDILLEKFWVHNSKNFWGRMVTQWVNQIKVN